MVEKFTYLFWLAIFILVPVGVLYLKFPQVLNRHKKMLFFVAACSVLFSLPLGLFGGAFRYLVIFSDADSRNSFRRSAVGGTSTLHFSKRFSSDGDDTD